ncbi:MAG: TldD/PmbA family protein [Acidobacteriota bacterium]|nr:TldD/PmbA family protein [Acidobacteriota bacterium]
MASEERSMNANMLSQERCAEIFDRVRRAAPDLDLEVTLAGGHSALTRWANNGITQNVREEGCEVSVRAQMGGRTARATTNLLDDDGLRDVVRRAEALARVQEEDEDLLPMLAAAEAGESAVLERFDDATAVLGAGERASQVDAMVQVARREGLNSAGAYSNGAQFEAIFNSRGVARWHQESFAEASVTMQGDDSSGWQKRNYTRAAEVDARAMAEIAAEKARRSARPIEVPPGKYTVILEPSAVADLLGFLAADFSGLALLEQRSCLHGRLGARLFGENITIVDDCAAAGQTGAAFDGEGQARQPLTLVERGTVKDVAMARATAARMAKSEWAGKLKTQPTGHGLSLPNESGEAAVNIVFQVAEGAAKSVEEMVAATGRGLLVTRLWYIREVDAYEKMLTGMTRDGTFLVENGRVTAGVRNLRFNQSVLKLLQSVLDLGRPGRACGEESFNMVAPAMRAEGFQFTEVTRF